MALQGVRVDNHKEGAGDPLWNLLQQSLVLGNPALQTGKCNKGFDAGFIMDWEMTLGYPIGKLLWETSCSLSCGNSDMLRSCRRWGRQSSECFTTQHNLCGRCPGSSKLQQPSQNCRRAGLVMGQSWLRSSGHPVEKATPLVIIQQDKWHSWQVPEDPCICHEARNLAGGLDLRGDSGKEKVH